MVTGIDAADRAAQIRQAPVSTVALIAGIAPVARIAGIVPGGSPAAADVVENLDVLGDQTVVPRPGDGGLDAVPALQVLRPIGAPLVLHGRVVVVEEGDLLAAVAPVVAPPVVAVAGVAAGQDDDVVTAPHPYRRALHVAGAVVVAVPGTRVAGTIGVAVVFRAAAGDEGRGGECNQG